MHNHSRYADTLISDVLHVTHTYAQELTALPRPTLSSDVKERLLRPAKRNERDSKILSQTTQNPSVKRGQYKSAPDSNGNGNGNCHGRPTLSRRYYVAADDGQEWPPELSAYNIKFAEALERIKRRHDSVVTTVGT